MTVADWVSSASAVVVLVVLAAVAVDRNRMKQRLANAEGAVTGLTLDLDAMAERVAQLQSYLSAQQSWAVDAVAPPELVDPTHPDRWTEPHRNRDEQSIASPSTPVSPPRPRH